MTLLSILNVWYCAMTLLMQDTNSQGLRFDYVKVHSITSLKYTFQTHQKYFECKQLNAAGKEWIFIIIHVQILQYRD